MSALYRIDVDWPGGGTSMVLECVDQSSADDVANHKKRRQQKLLRGEARNQVTCSAVPVDAANDALDTGPLPIPAGPSLEHAFAPGSREFFAACDADARRIVREGSAKGDAWLGGGL